MGLLCLAPLSTIVRLYRGCQLFDGGDRRNPSTSRKWLTNFIHIHVFVCVYIYVQYPKMAPGNATYRI